MCNLQSGAQLKLMLGRSGNEVAKWAPVTLLRGLSEDSMESLDSLLRSTVLAGAAEGSLGEDHLTRFLAAAVGATLLVRLSPFLVSSAMLRRLSGFVLPACQIALFMTGGVGLSLPIGVL